MEDLEGQMIDAKEIYYKMHLIRECEERIRKEYPSNEITTPCHLGVGAEAIAVGVTSVFGNSASYFGTYRNHALYLALGGSLDEFWGELYGKETGCAKGKAGSMHLSCPDRGLKVTSAVVGTTIPICVGDALASKYRGQSKNSICFFGDGATEEGVFHESLNFAALHKLPVLFVCEDNELAIHNIKEDRHAFDLGKLVAAYNIPYSYCAGEKLHKVIEAAVAIEPDLKKGPALIHCKYLRFYEHVGPSEDWDVGYRSKLQMAKMDPLENLETDRWVEQLSVKDKREIKRKVLSDIDIAVNNSKSANFPAKEELYTDVFEGGLSAS